MEDKIYQGGKYWLVMQQVCEMRRAQNFSFQKPNTEDMFGKWP
jgi:hypothetical protein